MYDLHIFGPNNNIRSNKSMPFSVYLIHQQTLDLQLMRSIYELAGEDIIPEELLPTDIFQEEFTPMDIFQEKFAPTDAFQRFSLAGFVDVQSVAPPYTDFLPPSRIIDLEVTEASYDSSRIALEWTAVGDDLDKGNGKTYVLVIVITTSVPSGRDLLRVLSSWGSKGQHPLVGVQGGSAPLAGGGGGGQRPPENFC